MSSAALPIPMDKMHLRQSKLELQMPRSAGDKLGPYELLSPLGEGGMGEVWRARDTRLNRMVALKFSKFGFTERAEREARAIAALNHPHICALYDVGPDYLVRESVEVRLSDLCRSQNACSTPFKSGRRWTPLTAKA
jgi:serine/threonine protein kinase